MFSYTGERYLNCIWVASCEAQTARTFHEHPSVIGSSSAMEVSRRDSLNPHFVQRLTRIQTAPLCRFCLCNNNVSNRLINITDNDRIQMLISECYHGCLGTLNGNAPRFVCSNCYQRLEQSYEFLLLASRVQPLVDTYTFHDGQWPCRSLLEDSSARTGKKRVASPDEDGGEVRRKRVCFEDSPVEEELVQLGEESASSVGDRCDTPANFEHDSEHDMERSEFSLERTLSGEITGSELFQVYGSSSSGSASFQLESPQNDESKTDETNDTAAVDVDSMIGELSKDLSMVQNLCMQIQAFGVGRSGERISEKESFVKSKMDSINSRTSSYRREDG